MHPVCRCKVVGLKLKAAEAVDVLLKLRLKVWSLGAEKLRGLVIDFPYGFICSSSIFTFLFFSFLLALGL